MLKKGIMLAHYLVDAQGRGVMSCCFSGLVQKIKLLRRA